MFKYLAKKIFGSANERIIRATYGIIEQINSLENLISKLTDAELANQTFILKERLKGGESLEHILPEAFATVREAAKRVLNMRHFDVQLIGGIILHHGKIAEMKTGEGKTLVATAPVYLNALTGLGVHVVTVNDYLARRDSLWMGKVYEFLELSVSCITSDSSDEERKSAYLADITYGTNNEFGFDYLRDNLKYSIGQLVQRPPNYAIVDEVDSILIDEARTPLIISGSITNQSKLYQQIDKAIQQLDLTDIDIDEKSKTVNLTEPGHHNIESILKELGIIKDQYSLYDLENMTVVHHLNQALKAHHLFKKDVDYIVKDGKIMIIDEFTGRIMDGRRYAEGLHQAIEAKEKVKIQNENQTLASVTFQNYFRMYPKLAGMTGTAMTEANEFSDIYGLEVVEIPTNVKIARIDEEDEIYKTAEEKYEAILGEIRKAHKIGQPILVGTVSIEKSELLSSLLTKHNIKHNVLNARYHEHEAKIIAQAGKIGAITIATNMAGRGTDIMLGGNAAAMVEQGASSRDLELETERVAQDREKVLEVGGLLVIGTERHESRRIDNQLRGRAGRQGDVGRTKFFLSLEDDLLRIFGSEKISAMLTRLGLQKGEAIVHPWISRSLEKAQQRVEMRNYEIRKNLLKFDDVVNEQRKVIYAQRIEIMKDNNLLPALQEIIKSVNESLIEAYIQKKAYKEEWDIDSLEKALQQIYGIHIGVKGVVAQDGYAESEVQELLNNKALEILHSKKEQYGEEVLNIALSNVFLHTLDQLWREHLHSLDNLRGGISLRAYAQKDPLNEYKVEAFRMFGNMLAELDELIVSRCSQLHITHEIDNSSLNEKIRLNRQEAQEELKSWGKVSRNELCPCGSGKKFKHCHGVL
ncbi:MAG: preprotein translocase subunit SecA [Candidatus Midichloria sp.]|uniref:Protein translocase subunit SecA n=1 Tax=Hyalomma marginatum TaxID=34627 RepID=A0A8S4C063_9ACAR|nr:preprotein trnaslocase subunit SecA [Hyalomma marginatum]CAG7592730.1 preprotein trnaslocase subunit SecA [Hyalomma marginatum]